MKLFKIGFVLLLFSVLFFCCSLPVIADTPSVWNRPTQSLLGNSSITVYSDPSCTCCEGWIDHLKKHGFKVTNIKTQNIVNFKQNYQVPAPLASCHTALIEGYVIEGHVPASDIKQLIRLKPELTGLSVPQMPMGTPGMEIGDRKDPFSVIAFKGNDQISVFHNYPSY